MKLSLVSRFIPLLLSLSASPGCSHQDAPGSESTSRNVNNDIGPVDDILKCKGDVGNDAMHFLIRKTAAVTLDQGILGKTSEITNNDVFFYCKKRAKSFGDTSAQDAETVLWNCDESRLGDGRFHVKVYRKGLSAKTLAEVTIDQIYPLKPQILGTLGCRKK